MNEFPIILYTTDDGKATLKNNFYTYSPEALFPCYHFGHEIQ